MPPNDCHPPPVAFPQPRADAGIALPPEFPNEVHPPALPPKFRASEFRDSRFRDPEFRNIDCQPPERSKLRADVEEPKLREPADESKPLPPNEREPSPPKLELRAELLDWGEKNPPDLASERSFILPPLA
jgi:hypothetical protein